MNSYKNYRPSGLQAATFLVARAIDQLANSFGSSGKKALAIGNGLKSSNSYTKTKTLVAPRLPSSGVKTIWTNNRRYLGFGRTPFERHSNQSRTKKATWKRMK